MQDLVARPIGHAHRTMPQLRGAAVSALSISKSPKSNEAERKAASSLPSSPPRKRQARQLASLASVSPQREQTVEAVHSHPNSDLLTACRSSRLHFAGIY